MKKINIKTLLLIVIIMLAAFLRLYKLTSFPDGFNADEAALGYNAYSVLTTGHDEHGHFMPIAFESFGDYKAGLYVYIIMPFVRLLGLSELAVRLPSALFGVGTVILIYYLAKQIFDSELVALLAAFFLAISPWQIHFSRGGWEVNVATFFITLGVYGFLKGLDRPKWFFVCFFSWLAAMYTYQSPKIIVPLLGIGLFGLYWRTLWGIRRALIAPLIVGIIVGLPLVSTLTGKATTARFSGVSIFADTGPLWSINQSRGEYSNPANIQARIFYNKAVIYGLDFLKNYSDHFTPSFLFFNGDVIERNNVPEMGQMYVYDALFVLLGFWFLVKSNIRDKKAILLWLVIAPTAAAITFQTPHALRAHNMLIPLILISAFGFSQIILWAKQRGIWVVSGVITLSVLIGSLSFAKYLHEYYVHVPMDLPFANNYGFNQLVPYIESMKPNYDKVIVTDVYDQPYILFLFFSDFPPSQFQGHHVLTPRDTFGFSTVRLYGSYEFRPVTADDLKNDHKTLLIGTDKEIPDNDPRIIKIIYFPSGKPAFKVVST